MPRVLSLVVVGLVLVALLGCSSVRGDKEYEEYMARNNLPIPDPKDNPVPSNCRFLTAQLFDEQISRGKWIVFFHAPWSSASRRMESIWEEFTFQGMGMYPNIKFGRVDCNLEQALCKERFQIENYPIFLGIQDGKMVEMRDEESNDGLHRFVRTSWDALKHEAKPVPDAPGYYFLRYQRFKRGLEPLLQQVPESYIYAGAISAGVLSSLVLAFIVSFICDVCRSPAAHSSTTTTNKKKVAPKKAEDDKKQQKQQATKEVTKKLVEEKKASSASSEQQPAGTTTVRSRKNRVSKND